MQEVMFEDESFGLLTKDGLMYILENTKELRDKLDSAFIKGNGVWFFNKSKDRMCAEVTGVTIRINPSAVVTILNYPVLFEKE